jgi:hypothetical protein
MTQPCASVEIEERSLRGLRAQRNNRQHPRQFNDRKSLNYRYRPELVPCACSMFLQIFEHPICELTAPVRQLQTAQGNTSPPRRLADSSDDRPFRSNATNWHHVRAAMLWGYRAAPEGLLVHQPLPVQHGRTMTTSKDTRTFFARGSHYEANRGSTRYRTSSILSSRRSYRFRERRLFLRLLVLPPPLFPPSQFPARRQRDKPYLHSRGSPHFITRHLLRGMQHSQQLSRPGAEN